MKNLIKIALILICIKGFAQEKKRVFAPSFDQQYANLVVMNNGKLDTLKVIQEVIVTKEIKMQGKQYNRFKDPKIDNGTYYMKKIFRCKPVDIERFFQESYLCEYFYNDAGKNIIILQQVPNGLTLRQ